MISQQDNQQDTESYYILDKSEDVSSGQNNESFTNSQPSNLEYVPSETKNESLDQLVLDDLKKNIRFMLENDLIDQSDVYREVFNEPVELQTVIKYEEPQVVKQVIREIPIIHKEIHEREGIIKQVIRERPIIQKEMHEVPIHITEIVKHDLEIIDNAAPQVTETINEVIEEKPVVLEEHVQENPVLLKVIEHDKPIIHQEIYQQPLIEKTTLYEQPTIKKEEEHVIMTKQKETQKEELVAHDNSSSIDGNSAVIDQNSAVIDGNSAVIDQNSAFIDRNSVLTNENPSQVLFVQNNTEKNMKLVPETPISQTDTFFERSSSISTIAKEPIIKRSVTISKPGVEKFIIENYAEAMNNIPEQSEAIQTTSSGTTYNKDLSYLI